MSLGDYLIIGGFALIGLIALRRWLIIKVERGDLK